MIVNSVMVQGLKICIVDKSMKIPANGHWVYQKKALAQLWMTFARDCSGIILVCEAICYCNKSW